MKYFIWKHFADIKYKADGCINACFVDIFCFICLKTVNYDGCKKDGDIVAWDGLNWSDLGKSCITRTQEPDAEWVWKGGWGSKAGAEGQGGHGSRSAEQGASAMCVQTCAPQGQGPREMWSFRPGTQNSASNAWGLWSEHLAGRPG